MVFSFVADLYVDNDRQQMDRYSFGLDDLIKSRPTKDVKAKNTDAVSVFQLMETRRNV